MPTNLRVTKTDHVVFIHIRLATINHLKFTFNSSPRSAAYIRIYASVTRVSIGLDSDLSPIRRQAII